MFSKFATGFAAILFSVLAGSTNLPSSAAAGDGPIVLAAMTAPRMSVATVTTPVAACKVGRPAYCFKYQGVCENNAVGKRDCQAWAAACGRCHEVASTCASATSGGTAQCGRCGTHWSQCMDRSYAAHWGQPHKYKKTN